MTFAGRNWNWLSSPSGQNCDKVDLPWRDVLEQDFELEMELIGTDLELGMRLIRFYFADNRWMQCENVKVVGNSGSKSIKKSCILEIYF